MTLTATNFRSDSSGHEKEFEWEAFREPNEETEKVSTDALLEEAKNRINAVLQGKFNRGILNGVRNIA